jgi:hypothetical protein
MRKVAVSVALLAALPVATAHAYIGPGAGAGTIAIVLGILSSIFLAFVGVLWYPIKRLFKGRKSGAKAAVTDQQSVQSPGARAPNSAPAGSPSVAAPDRH